MGWETLTVLEVSGSGCVVGGVIDGEGGGEGARCKGGGEVITPSSWGLCCSDNRGEVEVAVRVEASVGWETERSSYSNNGNSSSSSSNFQRLEPQ